MISAASVPRRRPGVSIEQVGDQAVMLDAAGTVARGLNATAVSVWELIDGVRSVREIADALGEGDVVGDVVAFLGQLEARGLIDA